MKGITGNSALEAYRRAALAPVSSAKPAAAPEAAAPAERHPTEASKLSISTEARDLAAKGEAKVNAQKVESLKSSVADGSFKVNSHLVAERMLSTLG